MYSYTDLDRWIFTLINSLPHTPYTDLIANIISGSGTFGLVWIILGLYLIYREDRRDHKFFFTLFSTGLAVFVLSEMFLKPYFARVRPEAISGAIIVAILAPDSYSFPSSHAAFAFAFAALLSEKEPSWKYVLYFWAVLIALSRIYLGVHYPFDVVVGGALGYAIGKLMSMSLKHISVKK